MCTKTMEPAYTLVKALLFNVCLLVLQSNASTEQIHEINILFIVSFGQSGFNSSGVIPAAEMALEDINNAPDLLPGYKLTYDQVRDSQCHRGRSLDAFFDGIQSDPVKLAVVGCGCSIATEPVAEISHQWNISQISYASTLAALSDRSRFPNYFRNDLPVAAPALHATMDHFKWKRIALLTQDESLFTVAESTFRNELEPAGITVVSRMFKTTEDPVEPIKDLFDDDYRVFFLNSYSGITRKIICFAHKRNYTYPQYVFMAYDWFPPNWWTFDRSHVHVDCTDDELATFVERSLSFQWRPVPEDNKAITDTGKSLVEFEAEYQRRGSEGGYATITRGSRLYDGLWALAFALNRTVAMVNSGDISETTCQNASGSLVPLHQFTYSNQLMGCLIQWSLKETNFSGLTGNVRFDKNGTRIYTTVKVLQYQREGRNIVRKQFGVLDELDNYSFNFIPGFDDNDIYPLGVPLDGTPIKTVHTFHVKLVVIFDILAIAGILFGFVCLLFNIIFRKRRTVRLTSPNLNYFIIAGTMLMYLSIYFYLLPTTSTVLVHVRCVVQRWCFNVGYTLAFGTVLAKMWRVYHIFNNPQPNKKVLTDWHLIGIVLGASGIITCLLLLGEAIPRLRDSVTEEQDAEKPQGTNHLGVTESNYVLVCYASSSPTFYWEMLMFAYLIVLQIIGLVLAFQTRKVKLHGLRDSKFVAAIIYISSIILVALALVTFSLRTYINIGTAIITFGVFSLTTIFLALMFIPKMVLLWKDPQGRRSVSTIKKPGSLPPDSNSSTKEVQKIANLEKSIAEKDNIIAQLKEEVRTLKENHDSTCTEV